MFQTLFGLQLYPPRLRDRMQRDSLLDSRALHPALSNAIFLVACSCGGPEMQPYEDLFLERTRQASTEALALAQLLEDYITASTLQAVYLTRVGRLQEAYELTSSTPPHSAPPDTLCSLTRLRSPQPTGSSLQVSRAGGSQ